MNMNGLLTSTTTTPGLDPYAGRRALNRRKSAIERQRKEDEPRRRSAHLAVAAAVRSGALVRPGLCSSCSKGDRKIVAHHHNYSKPLDVVWLCNSCHLKLHGAEKRAAENARHEEFRAMYEEERRLEAFLSPASLHWGRRPSQRDNEGEEGFA